MADPLSALTRLLNEGGTVREVTALLPMFGCFTANVRRSIKLGKPDDFLPAAVVERLFSKPDLGGRPPQPFWDDMLMHVFARLYVEGWEPASQARLVDEMDNWLIDRGMTASPASIEKRASMLWRVLELRPKP